LVTDSCERAVAEVVGFYANYDSLRYVGDRLVVRMQQSPTDDQLAQLNDKFGHLCTKGGIERADPSTIEVRENDQVGLARIACTFAKHGFGDLRNMIDALNSFV
jgi:hypothetical protein